jgi:hypothetical protein
MRVGSFFRSNFVRDELVKCCHLNTSNGCFTMDNTLLFCTAQPPITSSRFGNACSNCSPTFDKPHPRKRPLEEPQIFFAQQNKRRHVYELAEASNVSAGASRAFTTASNGNGANQENVPSKRQCTTQMPNTCSIPEPIVSTLHYQKSPVFASSEMPNLHLFSGYANPIPNIFSCSDSRHAKRKREEPLQSSPFVPHVTANQSPDPRKRPFVDDEDIDKGANTESINSQRKRPKTKSALLEFTDWLYWRRSCSGAIDD